MAARLSRPVERGIIVTGEVDSGFETVLMPIRFPRQLLSISSMNTYPAVNSGGYLSRNSLRTLVSLWLKYFQKCRNDVRMNMLVNKM